MVRPEDIRSLTEFMRNTREHLIRLKRTGRPELLIVNGKAEVVVPDPAAYERLLAAVERAKGVLRNR